MEKKYRILVVDDEAEHGANIKDILEMNGYAVNTARSGKEAISFCQKDSYDLAIVDIKLPDISGNTVVSEMAKISPSTEYIYITGYASIDTAIEAAKQEHVISYETKPINMDRLLPIIRQIAVRKQAEEELQESEKQKRQLLNSLQEGVYQCEPGVEGTFTWINQAGAEMFGYKSPEEMIGTRVKDIYVDLEDGRKFVEKLEKDGVWRNFVSFCKKKNGERFYTERTSNITRNEEDQPIIIEGIFRDITERKQTEEKFKHLAFHDPLTDLPNRMLFYDRLNLAIAHAYRKKEGLTVLFLDLDRFKGINDTLGHRVGDQLLQDIADRLKNCIREGDTVARFGGDEFNLLFPGINHVEDINNITRKIINTLKQPLVIDNYEFYITTSIGVSIYPHDGKDSETLLKNADTAMYHAKEHGRKNLQFYSTPIHTKYFKKMIMEDDLRRAVELKEFELYYQPQVNINTGHIIGVEALVRWHYPNRGMIFPDEFLHLAEDTRLIVNIDKLILHSVCVQNKAWQDKGFQVSCVSVNLSAHMFQEIDLIETVTSVLKKTDIDPSSLMLEIPESIAMQNLDSTIRKLEKLCDLGIKIAIDDFGTGFSSLYYLKKFPINKLKISQHFVRDIVTDQNDKVIVSLVIDLAHSLKLKVIAEGVETSQQLSFLKQRQCDEMQGYLFSKPVPAEKFEEMLVHDKRLHS